MTCDKFSEQIPELVEGALTSSQVDLIERHAMTCNQCSRLIQQLQAIRDDLRLAIDSSIDPAVLAAVRTSVLQQLATPPVPSFFGMWRARIAVAVVGVGIAAIAITWNALRQTERVPEPTIAVVQPIEQPPIPEPVPPPVSLGEQPQPPAPAEQPKLPPKPQTEIEVFAINMPPDSGDAANPGVILKLPSTNPNVVLYWISDGQGGL
jgi:hypothetical protein